MKMRGDIMGSIPSKGLFLIAIFCTASVAHAEGQQPGPDPFALPDLGSPLYLADAQETDTDIKSSTSPECLAFAKDADADLGEVLRAGCQPTLAQMSALMDNPLGNVAMWINQYDSYHLRNDANGAKEIQGNYMGILQFPKGINEDWNLINRVIYNVTSVPLDQDKLDNLNFDSPGTPPGHVNPGAGAPVLVNLASGRTTGFGDMYYVGLFSKKEPIQLDNGAKFVWGAGFDVGLPTATEDVLGTGKWTVGPSVLAVYLGEKWKGGALLTNYWDFAGDSDRDDVRLSNLQYLYYYSLDNTTSIGAGPNIIADWEQKGSDRFTVPVGLGINKTINIGKVPVRFGVEAMYSVHRPDDIPGTKWDFRFYVIPAIPSALFGWMQ
jgi:hypothetical protein